MDQGMISALVGAALVRLVGVLTSWESLRRARVESAAFELGGWALYSAAQVMGLLALGSGSAHTSPWFLSLSAGAVYLLAAAAVGRFRKLPNRQLIIGGAAVLVAVVLLLAQAAPRAGLQLTLLSQSLVLICVVVYAFRHRSLLRIETPVAYRWSLALVAASLAHVVGYLTIYSTAPAFTPVVAEAALAVVGIVFFIQLDSDVARFRAKQATESLEERGRLLQRSQEIAHFGSWEFDHRTHSFACSPETSRIFGVESNPDSYRVLLGEVHPDDRKAAEQAYRESILDGSVHHLIQHRILGSDGAEARLVTQECHHERDESGNVVRSVGIVQDVTESKRIEDERERRARFDRILTEIASALVGRTVVDVEQAVYHVLSLIGEFTGAGHAHVCLYGESDDTIDKSYEWRADCVEPDSRSVCSIGIEQRIPGVNDRIRRHETVHIPDVSKIVSVEKELVRVLEAAQVRSLVLLPIHIGDGTLGFLGLDSVVPGREWLHEFGGLLGLVADLLGSLFERTKSEQAVRESEERMQLALEGADLGTWDWNVLTDHVIYSERWATMLGYVLDEIPPHLSTWEQLVHPDDIQIAMDAMTAHIEGATDFYEAEVKLRHKDGHWVWVLARGRVIERDADGSARRFCGTHQDVTKRRLAEDQLRVVNERLEQIVEERTAEALHANLAKGEFLAAMSHELRTPLNSVIGFSGVLLSGQAGEINEEQEKQLRMIQGSGKHLLRLVNDILDLSKIDAEAVGVDLSATDINQLCGEAAEYLRPEAVQKGLELRFVPCTMRCCRDGQLMTDRGKFLQIVLNLLSNAVKFTAEGRVELLLDCSGDGMYSVVVTDTGPGIEADALDRVFQRFEQIPVGGEAKPAGSGLGLSISRKLAGILGGTLSVESTPGVGSEFTLRLPLQFADDDTKCAHP